MDLLHRIDPVSGIYLNSSYQVGSPYIQRNGKGLRLIRLLLLTIIGVIFVTYCIIKKKI
jgi:hypothetical protein